MKKIGGAHQTGFERIHMVANPCRGGNEPNGLFIELLLPLDNRQLIPRLDY